MNSSAIERAVTLGIPPDLLRDGSSKAVAFLAQAFLFHCLAFGRNWSGMDERCFGTYRESDADLAGRLLAEGKTTIELQRMSRDDLFFERCRTAGHLHPDIEALLAMESGAEALAAYVSGLERLEIAQNQGLYSHFATVQDAMRQYGVLAVPATQPILSA